MGKLSITLCWECENACSGCSWSEKFIPVKGWEAIQTSIKQSNCENTISYKVLKCPLFKSDKHSGKDTYYKIKRNEFIKKYRISTRTFNRWINKGKVIKTENGYEIDNLYKNYAKIENNYIENDYS